MGSWRNDANRCRSYCTQSHLICHRFRVMRALCADFMRTDPVSAYSARLVTSGFGRTSGDVPVESVMRSKVDVDYPKPVAQSASRKIAEAPLKLRASLGLHRGALQR